MTERCDGQRFSLVLANAAIWLDGQVAQINALNVFPVPDGDTGTNMSLTFRSAAREATTCPDKTVGAVARAAAHGALLGARGNSGVILSQYLRGISRYLDKRVDMSPEDFAQALSHGSSTAYKAVIRPVEGTILTVGRELAQSACARADAGGDFTAVLEAAVAGGREALAKTPDLLPVLKQAGVVDAGGQGLVCILEGLLRAFTGQSISTPDAAGTAIDSGALAGLTPAATELTPQDTHFGYCTEFLLRTRFADLPAVRDHISSLGESALVVGDGDLIRVHVHTPNPGSVLQYACSLGTLHRIKIDNMQEQHEHHYAAAGLANDPSIGTANGGAKHAAANVAHSLPSLVVAPPALTDRGMPPGAEVFVGDAEALPPTMVAVAAGDGFADIFRSLGVEIVVPGGQTMNPSTEELLRAVQSARSRRVILLPNNSNILLAARQVPGLTEKATSIIPSRDMAQGVAAALAFQPGSDLDANAEAMIRALRSVRTAEITTAVRDARWDDFEIRSGQLLGLVDGTLVSVGTDMVRLVADVLERLGTDEAELLTVYRGADASEPETDKLFGTVRDSYPNLTVETLRGGQPLYHYLLCVE